MTDLGRDNPILGMPAAHPRFATARWIRPPRRCGYVTTTWTVAGLTAVLGRGRQDADLSPRTLVRLSAAGHPTARWRLPACIDGVQALTDPAARQVLVEADTGYGNDAPCGGPPVRPLAHPHRAHQRRCAGRRGQLPAERRPAGAHRLVAPAAGSRGRLPPYPPPPAYPAVPAATGLLL
ncbi:MAG: hypothetical protein ACRDPO_22695 [Streptosporangiaceae bacterium]